MSLGKKIVVLFLVLGFSFLFGSLAALRLAVYPAFEDFERESFEDTLSRVIQALDADLKSLEILNVEYSKWDHTYAYVQGKRPEYPEENFYPAYWHSIGIHLMLIFDAHGNRIYGRLGDPANGESLPMEEEFYQPLGPGNLLATHDAGSAAVKGLLQTHSGLMQIVSYPILTTDGSGPAAGSVVVGRFLTDERVIELGKRASAELSIYPTTVGDVPARVAEMKRPSNAEESARWEYTDERARGYKLLRDVLGAPAALVEVRSVRRITRIGAGTIRTATTLMAVANALFLLAAWIFMQRLIVAPVKKLTDQMLGIRLTGDLHFEAGTTGSDEVGVLAEEFGEMTRNLRHAQRELEQGRDDAVAMAKTKSEFLARMSHEIRTPMNGVLGMTELLRGTSLDSKQRRFAETIDESAKSLLEIINDVLDFSKMEAGKLRLELVDVDLRVLVEETIENLADQAQRKNLELISDISPDVNFSMQTDPGRLRQVLTNLVSNAIKFTEKGEVVVRLSATEMDAEHMSVSFEISDTGRGIRSDKQKMIFESFAQEDGSTTRLHGGTGLGLAISKQIVELLGSKLAVESTLGEGSRFSFSVRMKIGCESRMLTTRKLQCVAGKRVLIVDDNASNRQILEHQLDGWRAHTDSASSAEQAIKVLESAVASGTPHDLVLLDMHMPHTNGLECARAIRKNSDLAQLKLIILSSVASPVSEDELRELRVAGQLIKPIRQSHLYVSLAAVLSGERVSQGRSIQRSTRLKALSGRVLLAEDNPVNQVVATSMLEAFGITVLIAANGEEAVEKAAAEFFDVVLMDCQMPVMDGFKATEAIRHRETANGGLRTPIIAVTANALAGDHENCLAAGMDEYLTKPFTGDQLHSVLAPFLHQGTTARSTHSGPNWPADVAADTPRAISPPIDDSVLDALSRLQQPGAPCILQKVIAAYLETTRELKDRLTDAIDTANAAGVRQSAHALKSSSANVGATGLAELCKLLEIMGRKDDLADASTIREQIEQEYRRVVAALKIEAESATA